MNSNRKFHFSQSNKALTEEQRIFYEENGYIIIKNNVPHKLLDELCQHFIDICEEKTEAPLYLLKDRSLKNKGNTGQYEVNKLQDFLYDEEFFKYAAYSGVVDVVESIIGPNIIGVHSMFINKPPNSDPNISKHPLHQDLYYFPFRPINTIVASWTAMESVNEKNGCLFAIPGSHKRQILYPHGYPKDEKNALYHGVYGLKDEQTVNLIMEKGDTVFFHPLLLHGSGPNLTNGFRKAISVHYADSNSYCIDVAGTVQESIAKEVEGLFGDDYQKLWILKSRNVAGKQGSFTKLKSHL